MSTSEIKTGDEAISYITTVLPQTHEENPIQSIALKILGTKDTETTPQVSSASPLKITKDQPPDPKAISGFIYSLFELALTNGNASRLNNMITLLIQQKKMQLIDDEQFEKLLAPSVSRLYSLSLAAERKGTEIANVIDQIIDLKKTNCITDACFDSLLIKILDSYFSVLKKVNQDDWEPIINALETLAKKLYYQGTSIVTTNVVSKKIVELLGKVYGSFADKTASEEYQEKLRQLSSPDLTSEKARQLIAELFGMFGINLQAVEPQKGGAPTPLPQDRKISDIAFPILFGIGKALLGAAVLTEPLWREHEEGEDAYTFGLFQKSLGYAAVLSGFQSILSTVPEGSSSWVAYGKEITEHAAAVGVSLFAGIPAAELAGRAASIAFSSRGAKWVMENMVIPNLPAREKRGGWLRDKRALAALEFALTVAMSTLLEKAASKTVTEITSIAQQIQDVGDALATCQHFATEINATSSQLLEAARTLDPGNSTQLDAFFMRASSLDFQIRGVNTTTLSLSQKFLSHFTFGHLGARDDVTGKLHAARANLDKAYDLLAKSMGGSEELKRSFLQKVLDTEKVPKSFEYFQNIVSAHMDSIGYVKLRSMETKPDTMLSEITKRAKNLSQNRVLIEEESTKITALLSDPQLPHSVRTELLSRLEVVEKARGLFTQASQRLELATNLARISKIGEEVKAHVINIRDLSSSQAAEKAKSLCSEFMELWQKTTSSEDVKRLISDQKSLLPGNAEEIKMWLQIFKKIGPINEDFMKIEKEIGSLAGKQIPESIAPLIEGLKTALQEAKSLPQPIQTAVKKLTEASTTTQQALTAVASAHPQCSLKDLEGLQSSIQEVHALCGQDPFNTASMIKRQLDEAHTNIAQAMARGKTPDEVNQLKDLERAFTEGLEKIWNEASKSARFAKKVWDRSLNMTQAEDPALLQDYPKITAMRDDIGKLLEGAKKIFEEDKGRVEKFCSAAAQADQVLRARALENEAFYTRATQTIGGIWRWVWGTSPETQKK